MSISEILRVADFFYKYTLSKKAIDTVDGVDKETTFSDLEPTFEDEPTIEDEYVNQDERDQAKYNEMVGRETPSALEASEELTDQVHKAIRSVRTKLDNGFYTSEDSIKSDIEGLGMLHEELSELQESTDDHDQRVEIIDLKRKLENIAKLLYETKYISQKSAMYKSNLFKFAVSDYIGTLVVSNGTLALSTDKGEIPLLSGNNEPFKKEEIAQLQPWIGTRVGVKGMKHNGAIRVHLMDIHPIKDDFIKPKILDPRKADVPEAQPLEQDELAGLVSRIQVILSKITEKVISGDYESEEAGDKDLEGLKRLHQEISKWLEKYPEEKVKQQREVRAVMMKLNMFLHTKFMSTAGYRSDLFKQAFGVL